MGSEQAFAGEETAVRGLVEETLDEPCDENSDPLSRFVALDHERRKLEARLKDIGTEAASLQERIIEEWIDRGQQSANVGGLTVYVARDFYCSKRGEVSTEQLIDTLKQHGLDRCVQVGYNASSMKAWVKEQLAAGSEIPAPLAAMLNYDTIPRLRTRAS